MRIDRVLGVIVGLLLTLSTLMLIHGMMTASQHSQNRKEQKGASAAGSSSTVAFDSTSDGPFPPRLSANNAAGASSSSRQLPCPPRSPGTFWGKKTDKGGDNNAVGWCQQPPEQCTEDYFQSLPTYDDYIAAGVSRKERHDKVVVLGAEAFDEEELRPHQDGDDEQTDFDADHARYCDPYAVPFGYDPVATPNRNALKQERERRCLRAMREPALWESVDMIQPKFEQRTIKYVVTLKTRKPAHGAKTDGVLMHSEPRIRLLMKVPQQSFATEPFSEITAFELDRALHVNRIPPTVLVPFPLARLHAAAMAVMPRFKMVDGLGYSEKNFSKWWRSEFYDFVRKSDAPRVLADDDGTHVWVSLQLRLEGVTELLSSPLRVPYSKRHSGWHRWFNPRWEGFAAVTNTSVVRQPTEPPQAGYEAYAVKPYSELLHASMMALSELAIFDFLMLNNDRSPNKNNFIVEGCYTKRRWSKSDAGGGAVVQKQGPRDTYCSLEQVAYRISNGGKKSAGADDLERKEKKPLRSDGGGGGDEDDKKKNGGSAAVGLSSEDAAAAVAAATSVLSRAERRMPMTFVHLDQGMAFHGFSFVNNPVEKRVNNTFCLFYRPLMERVRCFLAAGHEGQDPARAEWFLRARVPDVAQRVLGRKKIKWIVGQLSRLIEKRDRCLELYGEEVVMQPMHFPRD